MTAPTTRAGLALLAAMRQLDAVSTVAAESPVDWDRHIAAVEAEAAADALRAARERVEALPAQPCYGGDGGDGEDMCPNCVTPWKCNGPHMPKGEIAGYEVERAAVLAALGGDAQGEDGRG